MLNVERSNLAFLKIYNTEFDEIIITFTDQNSRLLEMEDMTLFINKYNWHALQALMQQYSIEPKTRKYVKGYRCLSFVRKCKRQLLYTGLDPL